MVWDFMVSSKQLCFLTDLRCFASTASEKRKQMKPLNWRDLFIIYHFSTICTLLYFTVMEENEENLEYCKV